MIYLGINDAYFCTCDGATVLLIAFAELHFFDRGLAFSFLFSALHVLRRIMQQQSSLRFAINDIWVIG